MNVERQYLRWAIKKLFKLAGMVPEQNKMAQLVENVRKRKDKMKIEKI